MAHLGLPKSTGLNFSARGRAERLIAVGRTVLAGASLFAIWLDPSEPARFATIAYGTLIAYVVYAVGVMVWVAGADLLPARFGLATHALDLGFVTALQIFTDASSSPFFAYFIFCLIAAVIRWRSKGSLWTVPVVLVVFVALGFLAEPLLGDPRFEANRFIIRTAYLAVVAILITYLGAYEEDLRRDLSRLAGWPHDWRHEASAELETALAYAAQTLGVQRIAMTWEEQEEPWVHLATWTPAGFARTREPPGSFAPTVAEPLAAAAFVCWDAGAATPSAICREGRGWRRVAGPTVHPDLRQRLAMRAVLSVPLQGEVATGRLFGLDKPRMAPEDLVLAEIVGQRLVAAVDRAWFAEQLRDTAVLEERARLAHDLHDGVLQSLTALELKLAGLTTVLSQPAALRERLDEMSESIRGEHEEIARFVRMLPGSAGAPPDLDIASLLETLAKRVSQYWNVSVKVSVDRDSRLPLARARDVYLIIREAMLNAARHAAASTVTVEVVAGRDRLRIVVADNGRGFGFEGRYEHEELAMLRLGPASLCRRVEASGGTMTLESSQTGSRLDIAVPVPGV